MLARTFASLLRTCAGPERLEELRFSRRALLERSLAAGAGLLSGACGGSLQRSSRLSVSSPRIVVVGAGLGGLLCAHELREAGADVLVLEAGRHAGGRVSTLREPTLPGPIEAGGEFIGANHPLWQTLARGFDLDLYEIPETPSEKRLMVLGRVLSPAVATATWESVDAIAEQLNQLARTVDAERPWDSVEATSLDERSLEDWLSKVSEAEPGVALLRALLEHDNAVPSDRQCLLGLLALIKGHGLDAFWTDTETHRCAGGNQRLADALARGIRDHLRFEAPVAAFAHRDRGSGVRVVLHSGEGLDADHAVLAVPPSVWGDIDFDHAGLRERLDGIAPQMGSAVKVIALLGGPQWRELGGTPNTTTDGTVGFTWDPLAGAPGTVPGERVPLSCFAGGPFAPALSEAARAGTGALDELLEPLFPGITGQIQETRNLDWSRRAWIKCGYSFPAPGQVTRIGSLLRAGIGPLSFVGEHCTPGYVGFMEGALQSGARVARELMAESRISVLSHF